MWHQPKTTWQSNESVISDDLNRIEGNAYAWRNRYVVGGKLDPDQRMYSDTQAGTNSNYIILLGGAVIPINIGYKLMRTRTRTTFLGDYDAIDNNAYFAIHTAYQPAGANPSTIEQLYPYTVTPPGLGNAPRFPPMVAIANLPSWHNVITIPMLQSDPEAPYTPDTLIDVVEVARADNSTGQLLCAVYAGFRITTSWANLTKHNASMEINLHAEPI